LKKLKELLSDTLVYGISSVVARFLNYLLVPFYTDVFDPSSYGIVGLVYSAIAFLHVLFTFGMESAYLRYGAKREQSKHVFKTLQLTLLGGATLLVFGLWLLRPVALPMIGLDNGPSSIYLMMLGILWFDAMGIVPFAELRLVRRSWLFSGLKVMNVAINLVLNFYLVLAQGWGIEAVFASNLIASATTTLLLWGLTARQLAGEFNQLITRRALAFGLPFVPTGIAYAVNEFIDRFFLNSMTHFNVTRIYGADFTAEAVVGVYNACYKLAVFMLLFIQMFRMAWQPFFLRHAEDEHAPKLFSHAFTYFNMIAAVLFLGISLFAEQIVAIRIPILDVTLIGEQYWMGLHIVPFLLLAYWFQGWYVNFTAGIFIREKTGRLPQVTLVGAAVTIAANYFMVPRYGMSGAAFSTVASYAVMAIMIYVYSQRSYPVPYQIIRTGMMMATGVGLVLAAPYLIKQLGNPLMVRAGLLVGGLIITGALGFSKTPLFITNRKGYESPDNNDS